jgi:hypothetical protein
VRRHRSVVVRDHARRLAAELARGLCAAGVDAHPEGAMVYARGWGVLTAAMAADLLAAHRDGDGRPAGAAAAGADGEPGGDVVPDRVGPVR